MRFKVQYNTPEERELIIAENSEYFLIEEHNIFEGNFLVFSDELIKPEIVYTNIPATKIESIEQNLEAQKSDNLILTDALATIYEELLARGVL